MSRRPMEVVKPREVLEAVVKETPEEVTYLVMDGNSKVIVHEFTTGRGVNFMTSVAAFLSAYCIKTGTKVETMLILRSVQEEQFESIRQQATAAISACTGAANVRLTRRELQCSKLLVHVPGIANKEIANELNLSERTVKFHLSALLAKFQVDNRTKLADRLRTHLASTLLAEGN